ncbi:keratin-associated protein 16-1 [Solenopsis invicta]|uniref:keratin-associated protein 16-1 n=1 Tax=Solenopsis invicta TaxID=13686 RepID=UPI00193E4DF7|nr:keratin-associated protein 16-1 [Solenopsis invicta]
MSCYTSHKKKRISTLPPPCFHCKPAPFYCPSNGCVPPEPRLPRRCRYPPLCPPLICKPRPKPSPLPPTICIAGPCSQPSASKSYCRPSAPKILLPSSCVRFCIRYSNEGSSCYPGYWTNLPKCPSNIC